MSEPTVIDLVAELRDALGLPHPGGWDTPKQAWEKALDEVRRLRQLEEEE